MELLPLQGFNENAVSVNQKESPRQEKDSVVGSTWDFPAGAVRSACLLFSYSSLMVASTS